MWGWAEAHREGLVPALSELAADVQRGRTADDVLRIAGDGVGRLGMRFAAFQLDGDALVLRHLVTAPQRVEAIEGAIGRSLTGLRAPLSACAPAAEILAQRKIVYRNNLNLFDRFLIAAAGYDQSPLDATPATTGIPNGVLAPIFARDKAWGLLTVVAESFRPTDAAAVALFATHVGSALEVAEFVGALEKAQKELVDRERLAAIGELAAVVAHEVRNPLGAIFNALASLRRLIVPPDQAHAETIKDGEVLLSILREEAERINSIVSDLLDFARPTLLHTKKVSLGDVFAELSTSAAARPEAASVDVQFDVPSTLPAVEIDPRLLHQALYNLVLNALQAMPRGGTLVVRARHEGSGDRARVLVDVADSGPGIASAIRPRIFEPFFTTKAAGTGLGLPLVQRVVDAHRGELSVASSSAGTTFTIALPSTRGKTIQGPAHVVDGAV
jgi:signal transduction histidine kinase